MSAETDSNARPSHAPLRDIDRHLEASILELLARRALTSSICPSDAARAVGDDDWRGLMDASRSAAARLVARGEVEVTQKGEPVDVATARGPIRIRRPRDTA